MYRRRQGEKILKDDVESEEAGRFGYKDIGEEDSWGTGDEKKPLTGPVVEAELVPQVNKDGNRTQLVFLRFRLKYLIQP